MEEIKRSKEEEANPSVKKKLVKEVKGVVDEAPRSFSESDDKREILKGIINENKLVMKEGDDEGIKKASSSRSSSAWRFFQRSPGASLRL